MKATFEHTVSILVKAYLNDTLEHGNCYACAVGNIVADALNTNLIAFKEDKWLRFKWDNGMPYPAKEKGVPQGWGAVFSTDLGRQNIERKNLDIPQVKEQIDSTGYTWDQLARIERAFELTYCNDNDRMFCGLMNVIDVLAEIHNIDLNQKETAKALFVK